MSRTVLAGCYELVERIGQGGMAEVWLARCLGAAGFEKLVVIKRVLPAMMAHPSFVELLVREAKIAARLNHPNIVQIFDLGEEHGTYFIAMEYVQGKDLASLMGLRNKPRSLGTVSLPLKLWIMGEVAKALDYAHRRRSDDGRPLNIVHRDVSPHNILLGYEGEVLVADFGIARADEDGLGHDDDPAILRGKHSYMSPEQANGLPLDRRSDLFAFGVVLYELVTGARLFAGETQAETFEQVRLANVPPIQAEALSIPAELAAVLQKALEPNRDKRYQTAAALFEDLSSLLFHMRVHVGPTDLARTLQEIFPRGPEEAVNKLTVDALLRAQEDAKAVDRVETQISEPAPARGDEATQPLRLSKRLKFNRSPVVVLLAAERTQDDEWFRAAVADAGGLVVEGHGIRAAVFGHELGREQAGEQAARSALDFFRRVARGGASSPPIGIVEDMALVLPSGTVQLVAESREKRLSFLRDIAPGEIRCDVTLQAELQSMFRLRSHDEHIIVESLRSRHEREAVLLQRHASLIGRQSEMRLISQALVNAAQGEGGSVVLFGTAGVGKTRLLAELQKLSRPEGVLFIRGEARAVDSNTPYALIADVFREICGIEDDDALQECFAKVERLRVLGLNAREVQQVGTLLGLAYSPQQDVRTGRPRGIDLMIALRKTLRSLSRDSVVVLALEDVHWMDESTRQMLPLILHRWKWSRVLLVITSRPGTALGTMEADELFLEPLNAELTSAMFAARCGAQALDASLAERVIEATDGIPTWIESVASMTMTSSECAIYEGCMYSRGEFRWEVPDAMRLLVSGQLSQLTPDDRALYQAVCACRGDVDVGILSGVCGKTPAATAISLRRLARHRAVWFDTQESRRWETTREFVAAPKPVRALGGELWKRAVVEALDENDQKRLHDRFASELSKSGHALISPEEVSDHLARSSDPGRALPHCLTSAESALASRDLQGAAHSLCEAVRVAEVTNHANRIELCLRAADLCQTVGNPFRAEKLLGRAMEMARDAPLDEQLQVSVGWGEFYMRAERWSDAMSMFEQAIRNSGRSTNVEIRMRLLMNSVLLHIEVGEIQKAYDALVICSDTIVANGDTTEHGQLLCAIAVASAHNGQLDQAQRAIADALAITARLGRGALRFASLAAMAEVEQSDGDFSRSAIRWREAAEVACEEHLEAEFARASMRAALLLCFGRDFENAANLHAIAMPIALRFNLITTQKIGEAVRVCVGLGKGPDPSAFQKLDKVAKDLEARRRRADAALVLALAAQTYGCIESAMDRKQIFERAALLAIESERYTMMEQFRKRAADILM